MASVSRAEVPYSTVCEDGKAICICITSYINTALFSLVILFHLHTHKYPIQFFFCPSLFVILCRPPPLCTLVWLSRQRLAPHKPQCHKVIHQAVSFHFCPPPRAILFAASQVTLPRCRTARWLYSEADPSLFTRRMKQGWWKDGMQGAQMCLQSRKYVAELPSLRRFPWSILTHQWCDYCRKSQRPLQDDVNLIIFHAYGRFRVLSV